MLYCYRTFTPSIADEHCRFLVEQGVVGRLLRVIKPMYGAHRPTLEHAALSALRNLAIPGNHLLVAFNLAMPGNHLLVAFNLAMSGNDLLVAFNLAIPNINLQLSTL